MLLPTKGMCSSEIVYTHSLRSLASEFRDKFCRLSSVNHGDLGVLVRVRCGDGLGQLEGRRGHVVQHRLAAYRGRNGRGCGRQRGPARVRPRAVRGWPGCRERGGRGGGAIRPAASGREHLTLLDDSGRDAGID